MANEPAPRPDHAEPLGMSAEAGEAIARIMRAFVDALWDGHGEQISLWIDSAFGDASDAAMLESRDILNVIFKGAADEPRGKTAQ